MARMFLELLLVMLGGMLCSSQNSELDALTRSSFKGVAPDATLLMYKVFGSVDYTETETLIEAFLRAYDDGVCQIRMTDDCSWATG